MTLSTLVRPDKGVVAAPPAAPAPAQPADEPSPVVPISLLGAGLGWVMLAMVVFSQFGRRQAAEPPAVPIPTTRKV
ncbi:MAG: hypothetical protein LC799_04155 [Actinobacteria bacterium]|nr:hypothetical protein [Actinomycetota bacterium]